MPSYSSAANWHFPLCCDSGYAFGALIAGMLADFLGVAWAMGLVALLPFFDRGKLKYKNERNT